jgi:hypothetical protein
MVSFTAFLLRLAAPRLHGATLYYWYLRRKLVPRKNSIEASFALPLCHKGIRLDAGCSGAAGSGVSPQFYRSPRKPPTGRIC